MTKHDDLIQSLARCAAACEMCLDACLDEEDIKKMVPCIRLDRDCAKICQITAAYVASNSPHAAHIMGECIEIVTKCGEECGKHQHDHCQLCAKACRECAEACRAYEA